MLRADKLPRRYLFFFNDTATTEIYTLSLHDALPISRSCAMLGKNWWLQTAVSICCTRSEEHTSELQSHSDLVCRLLLEKKKKKDGSRSRAHLYHRRSRKATVRSVRE